MKILLKSTCIIFIALFMCLVVSCDKQEENDNSSSLKYYLLDDGSYAVGMGSRCFDSEIIIPSEYRGRAVTQIAAYGFSDNSHIKKVFIPDCVKVIGEGAFASCHILEKINLPKELEVVGSHAFTWCDSITEIILPEGVKSIGVGAFESCKSLAKIYVPKSVTDISNGQFIDSPYYPSVFYEGSESEWIALGGNVLMGVHFFNSTADSE